MFYLFQQQKSVGGSLFILLTRIKYTNKEKEISKNIAAYKAGGKGRQTKVIYCFDCDDYNTKQEDAFFLEKVRQYCAEQKYDFVWFCKDIERVYTGKKVNAVEKRRNRRNLRKRNKFLK